MKPGDKFNAIRKNGSPVVTKDGNLAEFTMIQLCSKIGQPEWYDCEIKGHPLRQSGKIKRVHQLFTRFYDFHVVNHRAL